MFRLIAGATAMAFSIAVGSELGQSSQLARTQTYPQTRRLQRIGD